jgi:type II secretory pathway component PulF
MKLPERLNILNQVGFVDKLLFTKHLSVMIKSGIPLPEAIAILGDQAKNQAVKKILKALEAGVKNGQSLEKTLAKYPMVFDPLYINIVRIGEESGTLDENLDYLSKELSKGYEFRKKVKGAMMYPSLVLGTAGVIGGGISLFVLPQLVDLFRSLDVKLPWATQVLLTVAEIMKNYGVLIVIGLILVITAGYMAIQSKTVKPVWHRFILRLPAVGTFLQYVQVANFCRNLGMMLKSGLPISNALAACADAADNEVFKKYIEGIKKAVDQGSSIENTLTEGKYKYMPPIVYRMVGVGEKTGKLDETLLYLANFYEEEVDDMTKNLSSILEPAMLVLVAGMVAFLAFAIISPIYQFTGSIKQ